MSVLLCVIHRNKKAAIPCRSPHLTRKTFVSRLITSVFDAPLFSVDPTSAFLLDPGVNKVLFFFFLSDIDSECRPKSAIFRILGAEAKVLYARRYVRGHIQNLGS